MMTYKPMRVIAYWIISTTVNLLQQLLQNFWSGQKKLNKLLKLSPMSIV
jgi:hypothetical protein